MVVASYVVFALRCNAIAKERTTDKLPHRKGERGESLTSNTLHGQLRARPRLEELLVAKKPSLDMIDGV